MQNAAVSGAAEEFSVEVSWLLINEGCCLSSSRCARNSLYPYHAAHGVPFSALFASPLSVHLSPCTTLFLYHALHCLPPASPPSSALGLAVSRSRET